jgi:hypothetical protein
MQYAPKDPQDQEQAVLRFIAIGPLALLMLIIAAYYGK